MSMYAFPILFNGILYLFFICSYSFNHVCFPCIICSCCYDFVYLRTPWNIGENQIGHLHNIKNLPVTYFTYDGRSKSNDSRYSSHQIIHRRTVIHNGKIARFAVKIQSLK